MTEQQFLRQIKRLLHCKADKKREILQTLRVRKKAERAGRR